MRLPRILAPIVLAGALAVPVERATAELSGCSEILPLRSGWIVELCRTDTTPLPLADVVLDGEVQDRGVGVRVYHQVAGHYPQVAVLTSDGWVRLKPLEPSGAPIQFGTSFVLGPAYWSGGYHHNPDLARIEVVTAGLPGALRLRAQGVNGDLAVAYEMELPKPTLGETRLHVAQTATAVREIRIDPVKAGERQGFKTVQFSSMFINQDEPCFGGTFFNCNDANAVRFLTPDGAEHLVSLAGPRPRFVLADPLALGDHIVELLQTRPTTWQGPTPSTRVILDAPPRQVAVQGWLTQEMVDDPRTTDNVGLWISDGAREATGLRAGERVTAGYTLAAGGGPAPGVQGFTWYADGATAKAGPTATAISVYGTMLRPGATYQLVSGRRSGDTPCATDVVPVNPHGRRPNSTGFVGLTAGPLTRPPGQWDVCLYEVAPGVRGRSAASPVVFEVTG